MITILGFSVGASVTDREVGNEIYNGSGVLCQSYWAFFSQSVKTEGLFLRLEFCGGRELVWSLLWEVNKQRKRFSTPVTDKNSSFSQYYFFGFCQVDSIWNQDY